MVKVVKSLAHALLCSALLVSAACGGEKQGMQPPAGPQQEESSVAKIEGEVFYRERIMIPPDSTVEVQLEDISRADAPATVVASVSFEAGGGPPYAFAIDYDPAHIDERMRYALRARITSPDGDLLFTNTEYIDPFGGNPVTVMVHGMARPGDGEPDRPEPDPETGAESVATADASATAPAEEGATVWVLATLEGGEAPLGAGGRPVTLQMLAADSTAAGFSGCNRYTGTFRSKGHSSRGTPIKFGPMAGTMMACAEGGDLERDYLQALGRVDAYRMHGGELELLSGDDIVATFKPQ